MIYAFIGNDGEKINTKARAWISASREKDSSITYLRVTDDSFDEALLLENMEGQSLFAKRMLITLEGVSKEHEEFLLKHIAGMAASENVFAIIDTNVPKKVEKEITKHAAKVFSFTKEAKDGKPDFALWNAIDKRDGLTAWKLYQKQLREGAQPEMVAGFIFSKLKRSKSTARLSRSFIDMYHEARRGEGEFSEGVELFLLRM